jgi:hypothetical protein
VRPPSTPGAGLPDAGFGPGPSDAYLPLLVLACLAAGLIALGYWRIGAEAASATAGEARGLAGPVRRILRRPPEVVAPPRFDDHRER